MVSMMLLKDLMWHVRGLAPRCHSKHWELCRTLWVSATDGGTFLSGRVCCVQWSRFKVALSRMTFLFVWCQRTPSASGMLIEFSYQLLKWHHKAIFKLKFCSSHLTVRWTHFDCWLGFAKFSWSKLVQPKSFMSPSWPVVALHQQLLKERTRLTPNHVWTTIYFFLFSDNANQTLFFCWSTSNMDCEFTPFKSNQTEQKLKFSYTELLVNWSRKIQSIHFSSWFSLVVDNWQNIDLKILKTWIVMW